MLKFSPKQVVILFGTVLLFAIGASIYSGLSHIGKTKVAITVIPSDAKVKIDNKSSSSGSVYLKPGKHTFTAAKEGYETYSQVAVVGKATIKVGLIPQPVSEEALQWAADHPSEMAERDKIGTENSDLDLERVSNETPIISYLPYTSLIGPFSIDYGQSTTRPGESVIVIQDSSPDGRANALKWIREHGQDPTDLEIQFPDFTSPLTTGGGQ